MFDKGARVGLVGLGIMGAALAERWRAMGVELTVWNLEPERFDLIRETGAHWAGAPAEVWAASDVVFTCVLGDDALESVCFGPQGFARAASGASLLVDLSTTSPAATAALAPRLKAERGASWVDAPMSGGPQAARDGELTLLLGGDETECADVRPLLDLVATNVTRIGDVGAGQKIKVLNQAIVGVGYMLMAELLATGKAAGIEVEKLPGWLAGGMADSTILQRIYAQMAADDFDPPRSYARQLDKDLKAVVGFTADLGLELPVIETAIARYRAYVAEGNQMEDGASVSRLYQKP